MTEESAMKSAFEFDDELDDVLGKFEPKPKEESKPVHDLQDSLERVAQDVAEKRGFAKRAKPKVKRMRRSQYYQTGRSEQIPIRGRAEDKKLLEDMCKSQEWVKGQALQYALDALAEKIADPESEFWKERQFYGVD